MENVKLSIKKSPWLYFIIAFVVFTVAVLTASSLDTQGGKVKVQDIYFTSSIDGSLQHGRLYIPANATPETPAPAVIWVPGNDTDAERCQMFGIEFSRRGYVVYLSDIRNGGSSVGANVDFNSSNGAYEATEFVRSLSIVDKENIAIGGHSLGGMNVTMAVSMKPEWYKTLFGYGAMQANTMKKIPIDAKINMLAVSSLDDGYANVYGSFAEYYCQCDLSTFDPNKIYGSFEENNARQNYLQIDTVHANEYFNKEILAVTIDFIQGASPAPKHIPGSDQVWKWRYAATGVALVALLFMLIPLGTILIGTPFFSTIVRPVPEYKGNKKALWWVFAVVTAIVGPLTYLKWSSWGTNWLPTSIFYVRRVTMNLGWALMIAGLTIAAIVIGYFLTKKEKRFTLDNLGLKYEKGETLKNIGKSLLLSVILIAGMYALVLITFKLTLVDMRIVNISFRALNWQRISRVLIYFLPFALCYIVLATNIHGFIRPKNGELSTFKEILVNIVILAPLYYGLAIWVGPGEYLRTHNGAVPSWAGFLYTFFWGVPLIMTIIATFSTYFFKKTGRVYLGAFLNAFLVLWTLVGQISLYA